MNESESEHSSSQPAADTGEHTALAAEAVDAIENLSGIHPGYRRAHAAGVCCRGFFRPSGLGMEFTEAAHLQEQQVNAIIRFSGSSTDPALADLLSPAKGMAVQFTLPDGGVTNLVGVTVPVFFARTPESFIDIVHMAHRLRTGTLGPIELMKEIVSHFSESKEALLAVRRLKPPASYAECHYYCIHAYVLVNAAGRQQPVRFEWVPETGVRTLTLEEAAQQPDRYLEDELELRFKDEPLSSNWSLFLERKAMLRMILPAPGRRTAAESISGGCIFQRSAPIRHICSWTLRSLQLVCSSRMIRFLSSAVRPTPNLMGGGSKEDSFCPLWQLYTGPAPKGHCALWRF